MQEVQQRTVPNSTTKHILTFFNKKEEIEANKNIHVDRVDWIQDT